ncbi:MAG: bifunctional metallophosphatase/5'-nucleotidase [Erysipelotrichaceae bacterium]|nr:bifunctional metallophosphatase/5'-nucleotidase [Erysipelotrichaceae bacterium]
MFKRLSSILMAVLTAFTLCSCQAKRNEDIYIVFTSDVHCGVNDNFTMASLKAYVDDLKSEHSYVTLADTGDYIQGAEIGPLSKGEYVIGIMNQVGYDIVTYGNHEFDYGMPQLKKLISMMDFDTVAANVIYSGKEGSAFENVPSYVIREYGPTRVAFIGILTPENITESTPSHFREDGEYVYDFYMGNKSQDLYDRIQETVDEARSEGADYVVALSHLGSDVDSAPYDSLSLISHTEGIDAVFDGHSHSLINGDLVPNKNGEDVLLASVGTKLQEVGTLIIDRNGELSLVTMEKYDRTDEEIQKYIDQIYEDIDDVLSVKVGEIGFDMTIADEEGIRMVRCRETNLADFVADAFRYSFDADIAFVNGGGVREKITAGDVTFRDILNVTPYQNYGCLIRASGQVILDELENGVIDVEALYSFDGKAVGESGGFLQTSGLRYTIDTSIPSPVRIGENGEYLGIEGERRVKNVEVLENGVYVPIDPEKMYTVAGTDYVLISAGNTHPLFAECERIIDKGDLDIDILKTYFETVDPETLDSYREVQGRITVK